MPLPQAETGVTPRASHRGCLTWLPPHAYRPSRQDAIEEALSRSHGVEGHAILSEQTKRWIGELSDQLPARFWLHRDVAARHAARLLGAPAFVCGNRLVLGAVPADRIEQVIRHELVHLAQVQLALQGAQIASRSMIEDEADNVSSLPTATPVRHGAYPAGVYCFLPLIVMAVGLGLYVLLRPTPANAPGPNDKVLPPVPIGQIVGEGIALFVVPGGAASLGGKIGLGFFGRSMVAGAASATSLRGVGDVAQGQASPPLLYLQDAATGAVIGFVIPGGFRLIGKAGTFAFDRLATLGMSEADIKVTTLLSQEAQRAPLDAAQAQQILMQRGLVGQVSKWYLDKRGVIVLYRGQEIATSDIQSPLTQADNVAASEALVAKLRALNYSDSDIASFSARHHTDLFDRPGDPPDLLGLRPGSVGIPASGIPGIASGFGGKEGVVYTIRMPRSVVFRPEPWPLLRLEDEYTIFNQVPRGSVVKITPASRIPALVVDENGRLAPAKQ